MLKDETNNIYGRLTVISRSENYKDGTAMWNCLCSCGNTTTQKGTFLRSGTVVSCGCYNNDLHSTHRMSKSKEYKTWQGIKERCCNVHSEDYLNYGAKGITVCEEWKNSFEKFLEDMGSRPTGCSIDRIDNSKGYYLENCRWATAKEQAINRSSTHFVTINGVTKSLSDWGKFLGMSHAAFNKRLSKTNDPNKLLAPKDSRFI
jgi:hypothetical protein